ncbi:MAG: hypothetical protein Fur002_21770 [Anaerolineales bacterium]
MRHYSVLMLAALLLQACGLASDPMFSQEAFDTAVAKTVAAGMTQNYHTPTFTLTPSLTFTPSLTPLVPTETPTLEITSTPTFPATETETATPSMPPPELSVSVNTNCRSGAGLDFEIQGTLLKGETAKVYGIDPTGKYWYIANPDPGAPYCWVSGRYANVEGAVTFLPALTPPPTYTATATATPGAGFRAGYSNLDGCGDWRAELVLTNQGDVAFKSIKITVKDTYWGQTVSNSGNRFINYDQCAEKESYDLFEPHSEILVTAPGLNRQPKNLQITVTLCSEVGLGGQCLTRSLAARP